MPNSKLLIITFLLITTPVMSLAYAKTTENKLTFKIICTKEMNSSCSQNEKTNTMQLYSSDIECVSQTSRINTEKNIIQHGDRVISVDSLNEMFTETPDGKIRKNDNLVKNLDYNKKTYSLNFKITPAAGNKLTQFTSANIGKSMEIRINNKVISKVIIQAPITTNFQITGKDNLNAVINLLKLPACSSANK